ncbi:MAG TPA: ParA family protein [Chitinivibrionales bacterium]|nr:ParA family protein [Chitinivibrionales bacterium]
MKIVSILNRKGGVGKTTFTGCTAQALSLVGFKVLAIDNDSQHNLSAMLGAGVCSPGIRDVYRVPAHEAAGVFLRCVRSTELAGLHVVTSSQALCDADVADVHGLRRCLDACDLGRFYDFVLIDNAPGMGRLQISSVYACGEIFVPVELRQFAVDGVVEMEKMLSQEHPGGGRITKIIPNFYRDTLRQNSFLAALRRLFPGRVTATPIPDDSVFDELVTENKILFLHRLASRGAAYYLKLIHELFDLDEKKVWEVMLDKRDERKSEEARERYLSRQLNGN